FDKFSSNKERRRAVGKAMKPALAVSGVGKRGGEGVVVVLVVGEGDVWMCEFCAVCWISSQEKNEMERKHEMSLASLIRLDGSRPTIRTGIASLFFWLQFADCVLGDRRARKASAQNQPCRPKPPLP